MASSPSQNTGSDTSRTELIELVRFWRQRYCIETFSTFDLPDRVLSHDEVTLIGDPIFWQGTSQDLHGVLNSILSLDNEFFIRVSGQLSFMQRAWDVILDEKTRFDAHGIDPNMSREAMEGLLLTRSIIEARANIIPQEESQSISPMSLDELCTESPDLFGKPDLDTLAKMDIDSPSLLDDFQAPGRADEKGRDSEYEEGRDQGKHKGGSRRRGRKGKGVPAHEGD